MIASASTLKPGLSALGKRWNRPDDSPAEAKALAATLKVPLIVATLLWQRGFRTPETAQAFLDPRLQNLGDPFALTDLQKAAERIWQAVEKQEKIVIFGDYDVDGITSSTLLWRVLRKLGATQAVPFLPHRIEEGYGLSQDGVERCVAEHAPRLLIAVDCGTTAPDQVDWLNKQGVEVIIVDHHALAERKPAAVALVNPQQDGRYEYLASVGLIFKLCHGLLKVRPEAQKKVDLKEYLDLVAVGTVADIVPLVDDNRIFVRRGLVQLMNTINPGLRALCQVSQIRGTPTTQDVGFRIGPRLNASGRLGDASLSLRLLTTDSEEEALKITRELDSNNRERQGLEQTILEEAQRVLLESVNPVDERAIVLASRGWHVGVIGIVASRIQRAHHRPTIIIGIDENGVGKGSGRSIEGCSLVDGLTQCSEHLMLYGGHEMAAGLTIAEDKVEAFRGAFSQYARTVLREEHLQPTLELSGAIELSELNTTLFHQIQQLAPFGRENPEPIFVFNGTKCRRAAKNFGRNHFKLALDIGGGECEAVAFGLAQHTPPGSGHPLAGVLDWDDYHHRVQIRLLDWQG
ncbi:MAG: single-stranded-DNA-specific exonuclease RecJ [Verrucomicrobia bacterium Tous-C9LFEB]|nr:MAG: single-stranded-DNA-specific exonuclease RecJ [Verrucomicrobia bacterium Tous-C9LFEB]